MMKKRIPPRATVLVKFVGDEDVVENITNVTGDTPSKKKRNIFYEHITADDVASILDEDTDDVYKPSSALSAEIDEEITEEFHDKLKLEKSNGICTPRSKRVKDKSVVTPKSKKKVKNVVNHNSVKKDNPQKVMVAESPYRSLRARAKPALQEPVIESDPEDSNEDSWEEESDASSEELLESESAPNIKKKIEKTMQTFSENYFRGQKPSKRVTSNRTMAKVELPKTSIQDLQKLLRNIPEYHQAQRSVLYNTFGILYKKWEHQLHEGFNILLHGVGSKYQVLQNFCAEILEGCVYIEVNGFYPSLSVKKLLNTITEDVIEHTGSFSSLLDQSEFIKHHFSTGEEDLYIIVHNIDGISLRGVKSQSVLSSLASSKRIHFIASVDHLNSSLIWNQIMLNQFRWLWYDATTYEPYLLETSYENSLLREQSNQLVLSSLLHVFESLTPNSRGVFLILARYQLEKKDTSGMTFQEWYQESREAFLVNSEATMDAQISEFKSHKLLTSKKSTDGVECWYIPVASATLSEFLEKVSD